MSPRWTRATLLVVGGLGLAACGGDDGGTPVDAAIDAVVIDTPAGTCGADAAFTGEIGRASCRERVCNDV